MLKSFKTEINPTDKQKVMINNTIGTCRFVYNFYIAHNKEIYCIEKKICFRLRFSKRVKQHLLKRSSRINMIKEVSSKSIKQSRMNGDKAFRGFFKG